MSYYYRLIKREQQGNTSIAYYEPSLHAQGAWNPNEQHMAPATGVICAELEAFNPQEYLSFGRINLDIWGLISLAPFTVSVTSIRPGRTIELLEARLEAEGKTCIVAHAWRMLVSDTSSVAGFEENSMPKLADCQDWDGMQKWGGGFIKSMQFKAASTNRPGRGQVWMNTDIQLVEGQKNSSFVHMMGMSDTSNGIVTRVEPGEWMFPNVDLNINLFRMPQGKWLGHDTKQQYGANGIGLTTSVLHDELGVFGRSEQTLTLRKM